MNYEMLYRGITDAVKIAVFVGGISWAGAKIVTKLEQVSKDLDEIASQHRLDHDVLIRHDEQLAGISKKLDELKD